MKKLKYEGISIDAVLLTFIKFLTAILGLVITRLLSEYLEVYEYGTYSQILLIVSTVSSFTIFGMMDGANYFYCREKDADKRNAYVSTIWVLQCIVSLAAGIAVMLLAMPLCRYFDNPNIKNYLIFAAVLPLLQNLLWIIQVLMVSVGRAKILAIRNLFVSLIRLCASLIIVFRVKNIAVLLVTMVIMDIVQIALFLLILRRNKCFIKLSQNDFHLLGDIFRYCAPMAVFVIVNSLNRDIDKYLVSMMTDTETLAMYANASKQLPFDILMTSFCTVLVPYITKYISERKKRQAAEMYRCFLEIAYVSTGILCCAALAAAPQLMKLLYSNKYTYGIVIFVIYIFVDLLRLTNNTLVLTSAGKTKILMMLGLGSVVFNMVLNTVLYNSLGLIGPAVATLIVTMVLGVLMLHFSAKALETNIAKFFDLKYLAVFVTESVVVTLSLSAFRSWLDKMDVHYFAILIIVAGLYGSVMFALNGKRLLKTLKRVNRRSMDI